MKQGPTQRSIPAQTETVCNGCEYLHKEAMMRGHKSVTDNYCCTHPDILKECGLLRSGFGSKGKMIHFNHEGNCTTPDWCPFLNTKDEKQTTETAS